MTQALSSARSSAPTTFHRPEPAAYRRRLMHARDAPPDNCTEVWWIQGDRYFCDARFTADSSARPLFHMGFAGDLEPTGAATDEFEWTHAVTAGASFGSADVGQLFDVPGWGLLEVGRRLDYVELWQRCPGAADPVWEARGVDDHGTEAVVVCVGDRFGLALGPDAAGNHPASVHIGSRYIGSQHTESQHTESRHIVAPHIGSGHTESGDTASPAGATWCAEHSSWELPDPLHFSITPGPDGGFGLSWHAGDLSAPSVHFHPISQGAHHG